MIMTMISKRLAYGALVLGMALLSACAKNSASPVQADPRISRSFSALRLAEPADIAARPDTYLVIQKQALEKEFLLHGSLIDQVGATTSHALQSRIVAFKKYQDRIFLLEATEGHVITQELPATRILAEIPIRSEDEDSVVMDFNAGMRQVFVNSGLFSSAKLEGYDSSVQVKAAKVSSSFISAIREQDNILEIRQIAQVEEEEGLPSVEVRYYLRPYLQNTGFLPRKMSDFSTVGYFTSHPRYEESGTGALVSRIRRWNTDKPVTFYFSANTPVEYRESVREGILYWNKVFGREVLRAELAPEGVTAPDFRYNLIQWVTNDAAGSAYADMIDDPRTGEILHAQVYLTNVFAQGMLNRSEFYLRRTKARNGLAETTVAAKTGLIRPGFLESAALCHYEPDAETAAQVLNVRSQAPDSETALRLARDYVRITVAHEVGHTLGLRHNFAGSLSLSHSIEERDRLFNDYLLSGSIPKGGLFTSSVMEYSVLMDTLLSSGQMREYEQVFPYDVAAIRWGYENQDLDPATAPLFCTDHEAGYEPVLTPKYVDCRRSDEGGSPVVANGAGIENTIQNYGITLVEAFIEAKTARDPAKRIPLSHVEVNPVTLSQKLGELLQQQAGWLSDAGTNPVSFKTLFPYINPVNSDEAKALRRALIEGQVAAAGGIDAVLFPFTGGLNGDQPWTSTRVLAAIDTYLQRPYVREGVGYNGQNYRLDAQEVALIRESARKALRILDEQLLATSLEVLSGKFVSPAAASVALQLGLPSGPQTPTVRYPDTELGYLIERRLGEIAQSVVLARNPDALVPDAAVPTAQFRFKTATRAKALGLLARNLGGVNDWSYVARADLRGRLVEEIEKAMGRKLGELAQLDLRTVPRPLRQWYLEQKSLLDSMSSL